MRLCLSPVICQTTATTETAAFTSYHITERNSLNWQCLPYAFVIKFYFWNDMTAYLKLPLE